MANEFSQHRTAFASFTYPNASATSSVTSGVLIPAGAIVTGIRLMAPAAVTVTGASGTVVPRVGTVAIAATVNASDLPAVSTPAVTALATTAGIRVAADAELNWLCQASSNSAVTGTWDYYVDYIYNVT